MSAVAIIGVVIGTYADISSKISRFDSRLDSIEKQFDARLSGTEKALGERISGIDARISGIDARLSKLEDRFNAKFGSETAGGFSVGTGFTPIIFPKGSTVLTDDLRRALDSVLTMWREDQNEDVVLHPLSESGHDKGDAHIDATTAARQKAAADYLVSHGLSDRRLVLPDRYVDPAIFTGSGVVAKVTNKAGTRKSVLLPKPR